MKFDEYWNSLGLYVVVSPVPGKNPKRLDVQVCVMGDLMAIADGAEEAEQNTYAPVMHVHDSIEIDVPSPSTAELDRLLGALPEWASGWPELSGQQYPDASGAVTVLELRSKLADAIREGVELQAKVTEQASTIERLETEIADWKTKWPRGCSWCP